MLAAERPAFRAFAVITHDPGGKLQPCLNWLTPPPDFRRRLGRPHGVRHRLDHGAPAKIRIPSTSKTRNCSFARPAAP